MWIIAVWVLACSLYLLVFMFVTDDILHWFDWPNSLKGILAGIVILLFGTINRNA